MKVICARGVRLKLLTRPKVATIGVFDGVHRGHRRILGAVVAESKQRGLASAVVTFDDHPTHRLSPFQKIPLLTPLDVKLSLLAREGIDLCYVLRFTDAVASMAPEKFVRRVLLGRVRIASLHIGEDFVFGRRGAGDAVLLEGLAKKFSFRLIVHPHLKSGRRVVSSTLIRHLLKQGNLGEASSLLGRPVTLKGRVIPGDGRGRVLGFPTANLEPDRDVLLPDGVYATWAVLGATVRRSLTYIGTKPTFAPRRTRQSVEVYLFDFDGRLYGRTIEVRFVRLIRPDRRFSCAALLVRRMEADLLAARRLLKNPL